MHHFLALTFALLFISCGEHKSSSINETTNNVKLDKNRSEDLKSYLDEKYKEINLDKYDPCKGKMTIRIWYSYGIIAYMKMASICCDDQNCEVYYYEWAGTKKAFIGKSLKPKNGWINFKKELSNSKI